MHILLADKTAKDMEVNAVDLEKNCSSCSNFFMEVGVENLGACMKDEAFLPFVDEIYDSGGFDCCYELYLKKRFDCNREVCSQYVEAEIIEIFEEEDEDELLESLRTRPMDDILTMLSDPDRNNINRAVKTLYNYICFSNASAYLGLLDFYNRLPAAEELEDVHTRVKIVAALSHVHNAETVKALVYELKRSTSNNVTRQLYTAILKELRSFPMELISEPVENLLAEKEFSYKIKKRIEELLEPEYDNFWRL